VVARAEAVASAGDHSPRAGSKRHMQPRSRQQKGRRPRRASV
jgi:hypothetical protein